MKYDEKQVTMLVNRINAGTLKYSEIKDLKLKEEVGKQIGFFKKLK